MTVHLPELQSNSLRKLKEDCLSTNICFYRVHKLSQVVLSFLALQRTRAAILQVRLREEARGRRSSATLCG